MPGDGPTWLDGLAAFRDEDGRERLVAGYAKIRPPMETYEHGLVAFDPETRNVFEKVATIPLDAPIRPVGHSVPAQGRRRRPTSTIADPVPADPRPCRRRRPQGPRRVRGVHLPGARQPARRPEDRPRPRRPAPLRLAAGHRGRSTPSEASPARQGGPAQGRTRPSSHLRDADTGKAVLAHTRLGLLERVPQAMGDDRGRDRRQVVDAWARSGSPRPTPRSGRGSTPARSSPTTSTASTTRSSTPSSPRTAAASIFFEGTYTTSFSGNTDPTPRYDYNQVMYRLDLSDPRLNLPVAGLRSARWCLRQRPRRRPTGRGRSSRLLRARAARRRDRRGPCEREARLPRPARRSQGPAKGRRAVLRGQWRLHHQPKRRRPPSRPGLARPDVRPHPGSVGRLGSVSDPGAPATGVRNGPQPPGFAVESSRGPSKRRHFTSAAPRARCGCLPGQ